MKLSLYSNKLDNMYQILNTEKIQSDRILSIKNNLSTIKNIYEKANDFIDTQTKINSRGKLKDDDETKQKIFTIKISTSKNKDEEITIFEKPKKIIMNKIKINLDNLMQKIGERYKTSIKNNNENINRINDCEENKIDNTTLLQDNKKNKCKINFVSFFSCFLFKIKQI